MSNVDQARRTAVDVVFAGTNITPSIKKYLLSLIYTDNEEDETDDLQIKLEDRSGLWLEKWLNDAIQAAAENTSPSNAVESDESTESTLVGYKVTSTTGLIVRSWPGDQYYQYGTLAYGTVITVESITNGWAKFTYSGKSAYVNASYLQAVYSGGSSSSSSSSSGSGGSGSWNIGDEVVATGIPQYDSYGIGPPGAAVTNYKGAITYLNLKSGIPYPIHVGYLGWFAESQVKKAGDTSDSSDSDSDSGGSSVDATKGLRIQAAIVRENWNSDGKDETLDCGQFELDSIVAQGPPGTVTIKGTSMPHNSAVRQTAKSKSWENYTLSGIANEIAGKNGMACMYESSVDPSYERVEQYRTSDIIFLQKLCRDAGCSLKASNNIIIVFDQSDYEKKSPVKTIKHGKAGGYISYKLSTNSNETYSSCRVSYVNSVGVLIEGTAKASLDGENSQCLEIKQKVANAAEAKALAEKMLRLYNKYELMATFTLPGDPKLLAGCTVQLTSWGAWSGKYIIKQARHKIDRSGYTTQITLRTALADKSGSGSSSGDSSGSSDTSMSDEQIDELARQVIRGDWGNGEERKRKLTEAGYDYAKVQARVNQILYG